MCEIIKGEKFENKPGTGYKVAVKDVATGNLFSLFARTPLKVGAQLKCRFLPPEARILPNKYNLYLRHVESGVAPLMRRYTGFHFFKYKKDAFRYALFYSYLVFPFSGFKLVVYKISFETRMQTETKGLVSYISKKIFMLNQVRK